MAYKYHVKGLNDKCERALAKYINISKAIDLLVVASDVKSKYLLSIASKFITFHRQELCDTEAWKEKVLQNSQVIGDFLKYSNQ